MKSTLKRKASDGAGEGAAKRKQWRTPKKGQDKVDKSFTTINPGDAGIWVTCDMRKEGVCTTECRDLFNEYADLCYDGLKDETHGQQAEGLEGDVDIEKQISEEITQMKDAKKEALFQPVKIDIQCVLFFKTRKPIEPVSFVHKICSDAFDSAGHKKSRWIKRFTPMMRMGKANEKELEEVTKIVLAPVFHSEDVTAKKFAIRTTIRNHSTMKRDDVIKQVANAVGTPHSVDLMNYDILILVDIYRNILGMSVVGNDFEKLKRFNLAEIYDPTPKAEKLS